MRAPNSPLAAASTSPLTEPSAITASRRNTVLLAAFLGWMFDGLEMGIFPLVARPALQDMGAQTGPVTDAFVGHWVGIITALFLLGAAAGGAVFGWLGDRVGRVKAMSFAVICYSLFTGVTFFAHTPQQLGAFRFLAALGMGGEWSLGVALVMEVWPEKNRALLAGLIGAANNVGFLLVGLAGMAFSITPQSWRWVVLAGASPAILAFFIRLFVGESEKWQSASAVRRAEPLREISQSPFLKYTILASVLAGVILIGSWGAVQWLPLWADQMAGSAFPKAKAFTQTAFAIGAIGGGFLGAWLGVACGRRLAYSLMCLASLLSCGLMFRGVSHYDNGFLFLTLVIGVCTTTFYGWLPLYLPELFPTRIRATAQGIAFNTGRVFAALGALQMGALMQVFHGSYAQAGAVVTLIYSVGLVFIWLAPETKGRALPA